jgi:hypothetical protein
MSSDDGFIHGEGRLIWCGDDGGDQIKFHTDNYVGDLKIVRNISPSAFDVDAIINSIDQLKMPITWTMELNVDQDPVFERAPHDLRGVLRWIKRCWSYSWRDATGQRSREWRLQI